MKEYWIMGKHIECDHCNKAWDFQGLFESEELAIEACTSEDYFIAPAILNRILPDETIVWQGAYYPLLESETRYPIDISQENNSKPVGPPNEDWP